MVRVLLGLFSALGMITAMPANAAEPMSAAEKIRRMDIMLMVTSLRCRTTLDNFSVEYGEFTTSQLSDLNAANAELRRELAQRHGTAEAQHQLDRLNTIMANTYGRGHPWLNCHDLKIIVHELSTVRGRAALEGAADQLLFTSNPPVHLAQASR